jgi:hypothetical protein
MTSGTAAPVAAAKRKVVPVPAWSELDGSAWGDLQLGQVTRAEFEREYSCSATNLPGVLEGTTSHRTNTQLYLVFDGPGPQARLAWVACFYDGDRGAPTPVEFEGRFGDSLVGGYLTRRRADWRLRVAAEHGVAAVVERGEQRERVAALIVGDPEALGEFADVLSAEETAVECSLSAADREPLLVRLGDVDVDVDVDRGSGISRRDLRYEVERAAESQARLQAGLRVDGRMGGRLAVAVDVEKCQKGETEQQLRIKVRATLDGEGPYGIVSARSSEYTKELGCDCGQSRAERETRRLVEQAVGAVAGSAQSQLHERRQQALAAAVREARLSLVASLND